MVVKRFCDKCNSEESIAECHINLMIGNNIKKDLCTKCRKSIYDYLIKELKELE